ncbi:MAG TPA: serine hydrolase domain-containing protein [Acidobacteriota bacterium]|nr:serine hydrolase domain-containing protein [Acidobacteriota bacterium]
MELRRTPTLAAAMLCAFALVATASTHAVPTSRQAAYASDIARLEAPRVMGADGHAGMTLDELMQELHVPAISIAVVRGFEIAWAKAYGQADAEAGLQATTDTLFQAASISKPVSAMAVLKAVQDGVFGLDDDINSILTSWQLTAEQEYLEETAVTPRLLMSMTAGTTVSGFPGYPPNAMIPTVPQVLSGSWSDAIVNTLPVIVDWDPNTRYEYSGGGVTILQQATADAVGEPFADFANDQVLDPIGMEDSCFCQPLPASLAANAARAYEWQGRPDEHGGSAEPKWHVYPELYAAGLWTTPTDLAKFLIEVQLSLQGRSNNVLEREMIRRMVTPGGIGHYALGFTVGSLSPHLPAPAGEAPRQFGHTGGNWGFRSNLVGHLDEGHGFVIMANSDSANPLVFFELPTRIRELYPAGPE